MTFLKSFLFPRKQKKDHSFHLFKRWAMNKKKAFSFFFISADNYGFYTFNKHICCIKEVGKRFELGEN